VRVTVRRSCGRPASELTPGEEGEDVWTEMDTDMAGGGADASWVLLARTAGLVLGLGLRLGLRYAPWCIDNELYFVVRIDLLVLFGRIAGASCPLLFPWAGHWCEYMAFFPLSARRYAWQHWGVMVRRRLGTRSCEGVSSSGT
jgi:hypothetical protein